MGTVGSWLGLLDGGDAADPAERFERLADVLRRVSITLADDHRPRHVSMEWAEIDQHGAELGFVDDHETDVSTWPEVHDCVDKLDEDRTRVIVETLFVELDVEVDIDGEMVWLDRAGELQFGVGEARSGSRVELSVIYSTKVDIWLTQTIAARSQNLDNSRMATSNGPRLRETLSRLASALGVQLTAFDSDRYLDELSEDGFRSCPAAG